MRIAIVFDSFGPYHMARLAGAAGCMDVLGVEVAARSVVYDWDAPETPRGIERIRLFDDARGGFNASRLSAAYINRVGPWRPDAIALPGWSSPAAIVGARWAATHGIPAIVMSDTNAHDFSRRVTTELVKRRVVTLFQAALCGGTLARSYLVGLGLPSDSIFVGYDVIDNDYFARCAKEVRTVGLPSGSIKPALHGHYFMASTRFVPKKNLTGLIDAFARYRQAAGSNAWPLVLLGDGPMRDQLERKRATLGLEPFLAMPGFKQYEELPLYYGTAGAFVHASTTEQWGLVVNEAMASCLPVLVSDRCGCAPDLVEPGRNGYTFDPHDVDALARLMLEVASDRCDRTAMGKASQAIIARWSPETFASGLRRAVDSARTATLRRPGLVDKALLWMLARR